SELCALTWRDLQPREVGGQATVFGKGGKTRHVLIPAAVWDELIAIRGDAAGEDDPLFRSRSRGGHLSSVRVLRIVKAAAARAGSPAPSVPTGCVMPMRRTRWIVGRQRIW